MIYFKGRKRKLMSPEDLPLSGPVEGHINLRTLKSAVTVDYVLGSKSWIVQNYD